MRWPSGARGGRAAGQIGGRDHRHCRVERVHVVQRAVVRRRLRSRTARRRGASPRRARRRRGAVGDELLSTGGARRQLQHPAVAESVGPPPPPAGRHDGALLKPPPPAPPRPPPPPSRCRLRPPRRMRRAPRRSTVSVWPVRWSSAAAWRQTTGRPTAAAPAREAESVREVRGELRGIARAARCLVGYSVAVAAVVASSRARTGSSRGGSSRRRTA